MKVIKRKTRIGDKTITLEVTVKTRTDELRIKLKPYLNKGSYTYKNRVGTVMGTLLLEEDESYVDHLMHASKLLKSTLKDLGYPHAIHTSISA